MAIAHLLSTLRAIKFRSVPAATSVACGASGWSRPALESARGGFESERFCGREQDYSHDCQCYGCLHGRESPLRSR